MFLGLLTTKVGGFGLNLIGADRAIILDMGAVAFDGTANEVLENEDLRQQYLAI